MVRRVSLPRCGGYVRGGMLVFMAGREEAWGRLRAWSEEPEATAVLTDIDGTLAPIVPTPDMSEVPA